MHFSCIIEHRAFHFFVDMIIPLHARHKKLLSSPALPEVYCRSSAVATKTTLSEEFLRRITVPFGCGQGILTKAVFVFDAVVVV